MRTLMLVSLLALGARDASAQDDFAIRGVRLFDGERMQPASTVVVRDGRIAAVGAVAVPAEIPVIDGAGRTLLPLLIDAHSHTWSEEQLRRSLLLGVGLQLDMMTVPAQLGRWRREEAAGRAHARADIRSAGFAATAPGGHGTQFDVGVPYPAIARADSADAWVEAQIAAGSDYIKIIIEDGSPYGRTIPTLDAATVRALVGAAHARGRLAVAHVATLAAARLAVAAGIDGLVHIWLDGVPDPAFVAELARRGVFVVPTLSVTRSVTGEAGGAALLRDERLLPYLDPDDRAALGRAFPATPHAAQQWRNAVESVAALRRGGVRLLAGTDAPNPGNVFGASLHRELELLVEAGLTPLESLRAATTGPAAAFGLKGRGRIAPGARADFLLVDGDPTSDIRATRAIIDVWKAGRRLDRAAARAEMAARAAAAATPIPAPGIRADGTISDFEDGTTGVAFGQPWAATTDRMIGGASSATVSVVDGGAAGSAKALRVAGAVATGAPFPWGGAIFFPGARPMAPADLSATRGIALRARGDGRSYVVLLFTRAAGQVPLQKPFAAGAEWQEHVFAWQDFGAADGSDVLGIAIVATAPAGGYAFELDDIRLMR